MQWTDEQISGIRKLASEGFTRREAADKLGISYDLAMMRFRAKQDGLASSSKSH